MYDVRTPMRDGVELSSDIWLPEKPGKYPAILLRTPYLKTEWFAGQEWCNGKIGTLGLSYLGSVQWQAARENPPHLKCMVSGSPAG
jgi:predicted acyl esterase